MNEKIYVGTGKEVEVPFGKILKMSFSEKDIKALQEKLENGWVNVDVMPRKAPSERGQTHYGVINEWKPQPKADAPAPAASPKPAADNVPMPSAPAGDEISIEDLPF